MRKRRRNLLVAAAIALVALAVAVPAALIAQPASEQTKADPPVSEVDSTTRALLGVFERPRVATDTLPQPDEGTDPAALSDRRPGESYDLSRRTTPAPEEDPVYIWPKETGACFSTVGVSSCADADQIQRRGAIVTYAGGQALGANIIRVTGIARDGVDAIEITLGDGTTTKAPVVDNAFLIDLASEPRQVQWTTPDGELHDGQVPSFSLPLRSSPPPE